MTPKEADKLLRSDTPAGRAARLEVASMMIAILKQGTSAGIPDTPGFVMSDPRAEYILQGLRTGDLAEFFRRLGAS